MNRGKQVWSARGVSSNDESSLRKRQLIKLFKWTVYSIYLIISYVIMVSPKLLAISGIKPLLLLPLTVCVSCFEDELSGGVFAIFAGLVWGANETTLFTGYYSLTLFLCCVICALFIKYFLKMKLVNIMFLCSLSLILYLSTSFFFKYGMWGYEGLLALFVKYYLPSFFYTLFITPVYFFLIQWTSQTIRPGGKGGSDEDI